MNKRSGFSVLALLGVIMVLAMTPQIYAVITNQSVQIIEGDSITSSNWGSDKRQESVVVDGGVGYVIYVQGSPNAMLEFSKSTDGVTWSTPLTVVASNGESILDFFLNVEGSNVDIFYQRRTVSSPEQEFSVIRSTNGGTSFGSPVVIDTTVSGGSSYIAVDVVGNTFVVTWQDITNNREILFSRSTDGGATFSSPLVIYDGSGGAGNSTNTFVQKPDIQQSADGTKITIAYGGDDNINGDRDLWESHSLDSGSSFTVPLIITGTNDFNFGVPDIFRNSNEVIILVEESAWVQFKSIDNGVTYSAEEIIVGSGTCSSAGGRVVQDPTDSNTLHLICYGSTQADVLYTKTVNFGDTWSSPVSISDEPLDFVNSDLELAVYASDVFATWNTNLNFSQEDEDVNVLVRSTNGGTTWSSQEFFIETNEENYTFPMMKTDGNVLYLVHKNQIVNPLLSEIIAFYEDLDNPASPVSPTFSGSATQVSTSGGVSNVDSYSTDERVYWIWEQSNQSELFFSFSSNGETNTPIEIFSPVGDFTLTGDDSGFGADQGGSSSIYATGDDVYVMYVTCDTGCSSGDKDLNLRKSTNGGVTFGAEIKIDTNTASDFNGWDGREHMTMKSSSDGDLYIFNLQEDIGDFWNLVTYRSSDNGDNWIIQSLGIPDFDDDALAENPIYNRDGIVVDGDILHLAVQAERSVLFEQNFYYVRSADEGVTWSTPVNVGLDTAEGNDETPYLIKEGDNLLVIMWEHDSGDMGFNTSDDNGLTWFVEENYRGTVNTFTGGFCDWENVDDIQDWDIAHLAGSDTVVVACGGRTSSNQAYMTVSNNMGATWSSVTEIDGTDTAIKSKYFSTDYAKSNIAFSWFTELDSGNFQIREVRASEPINSVGAFSSPVIHYDEEFSIFDFGSEITFKEPSVHVAGQGLWVSWVGQTFSAQSQDLFFVFSSFPNDDADDPVITLIGASTIFLNVGDAYIEQNASCVDIQDGSITVQISGDTVNTEIPDTYTVLYDCIDSDLNQATQKSRNIVVEENAGIELTLVDIICDGDTSIGHTEFIQFLEICGIQGADPPVITITGDDIVEVVLGTSYSDEGATAFDNGDGDLTSQIAVTGISSVNENVVGAYLIFYNVEDTIGNVAVEKIRTVLVVSAGTAPTGGGGTIPHSGTSVPTTPSDPLDTGIEGFTEEQTQAFNDALEQALIDAIGMTANTPFEEIIQTFFEFQVIDQTHSDITLQSFIANQNLGIRWSTGDDIVISSIRPALSPFQFTFEQLPVVKTGSGGVVSSNGIKYNLEIPPTECSQTVSTNCVELIRYSVPVTVNAVIDGIQVSATGNILVDLTEDAIDPIILILLATLAIPIIGGIIHKTRGGSNAIPIRRLVSN